MSNLAPQILESLVGLSHKFPNQRICQLIFNAVEDWDEHLTRDEFGNPRDLFYLPDDVLVKALNAHLENK